MYKTKFLLLTCAFTLLVFTLTLNCFAQEGDLELNLDVNSQTIPLPKIFKPNMDLSGRGFHRDNNWPQELAAQEAIERWQKDIGYNGVYRMQYNLWQIHEAAKDKDAQNKLLSNYESIMQKVTEAGGIVILDIFGTPAGLGKVLDKKSVPVDLRAFKELAKTYIRTLSCEKKYNIWYELWTAPDLDDFFLGRQQEYLNMYRMIAEAVKELEAETKMYIPLGGPSSSLWFRCIDENVFIVPERSLIYDLIRLCAHYRLPLDFVSWHAYSTDPKIESENTVYKKTTVALIRAWLSYFNLNPNIPLIVDEWNYDTDTNILPERDAKAFILASYIPARIKNMYEAGLDHQVYFSLEDFQNNKEGVNRNVGVFFFDKDEPKDKGGCKVSYHAFGLLKNLGESLFTSTKFHDEFVGSILTRGNDYIAVLIYNYIDPAIARNYLSRNIALLNAGSRKILLNIIRSGTLDKITSHKVEISKVHSTRKMKALFKKALELSDQANRFKEVKRALKINIKNLKGDYLYQRYVINSTTNTDCEFLPVEKKSITAIDTGYQENLLLEPYSVNMIILKNKPQEPPASLPQPAPTEQASPSSSTTVPAK